MLCVSPSETSKTPPQSVEIVKDDRSIEQVIKDEFKAEWKVMVAVAKCESGMQQFGKDGKVILGKVNSNDVGLMQINTSFWGEEAKKLGHDIYTVEGNVKMAKVIYERQGLNAWLSHKCFLRSIPT